VRTLRILVAALGLLILVSSLAMDEPDVFRVRGPAAIAAFVIAAGVGAADAFPLRKVAAACSVATMVVAVASMLQLPGQPAYGAVIAALQAAPWAVARLERSRAA
jgi:hypothetical protein